MNVTANRLDLAESTALFIVAFGTLLFGTYGIATHSANTVPYVATVCVLTVALVRFRRTSIPAPIAITLAVLGVAHLAGGLVNVGDDVLYNAHIGSRAIEYDHFVHALGICLGTIALWTAFVPHPVDAARHGHVVLVVVLAGLGLGAVNETIEFLLTLSHGGTHVGGYTNTGWDLVSNIAGGIAAALYLRRS